MHGTLLAARERRTRLRRLMALEIEETPDFLRLYKLAGLNLITTYALVAIIGDITRFATSRKLARTSHTIFLDADIGAVSRQKNTGF